jgi:hypothetical protein
VLRKLVPVLVVALLTGGLWWWAPWGGSKPAGDDVGGVLDFRNPELYGGAHAWVAEAFEPITAHPFLGLPDAAKGLEIPLEQIGIPKFLLHPRSTVGPYQVPVADLQHNHLVGYFELKFGKGPELDYWWEWHVGPLPSGPLFVEDMMYDPPWVATQKGLLRDLAKREGLLTDLAKEEVKSGAN